MESIDEGALKELRSLLTPPAIIVSVMEGVCILFGSKQTDWAAAKL